MHCVVCGKDVPFALAEDGGMNPWCSTACGSKWRTRNDFLFKGGGASLGEQILGQFMKLGGLEGDHQTLALLSQVSKGVRPVAKAMQLGGEHHKSAEHVDKGYWDKEAETVIDKKLVGTKKVATTKTLKNGKVIPWSRTENIYEEKKRTVYKDKFVIPKVPISADKMFEIALMAYNTAIELKTKGLSVILYRVADKGTLTKEEKKQTLSSAVHAVVPVKGTNMEVWPLQKTAAWIQGAMRARVPFILLNDPRGKDILVGGVDKASDAVFVRELHQITSMHYTIEKASEEQTPAAMKKKKVTPFVLSPPAKEIGPLPLIPRLTSELDWDHTWNGKKSNLTIGDTPELIRVHLAKMFTEAGDKLSLPEY